VSTGEGCSRGGDLVWLVHESQERGWKKEPVPGGFRSRNRRSGEIGQPGRWKMHRSGRAQQGERDRPVTRGRGEPGRTRQGGKRHYHARGGCGDYVSGRPGTHVPSIAHVEKIKGSTVPISEGWGERKRSYKRGGGTKFGAVSKHI